MMKKIVIAVFLTAFVGISGVLAEDTPSFQEQLQAKSPIYWLVEIGKDGISEINSYSGSIEVVGGKITVAKDILFGTKDSLTSENGDVNTPSSKIYYSFSSPFYEGLVLKVFPDKDFVVGGNPEGSVGRLIFKEKIGGKIQEVLDFPFNEFLNRGQISAGDFWISSIYFDKNATLDQRNASFKTRMAIATQMLAVLTWARDAVMNDKIDASLYERFDALAESAWQIDTLEKNYFDTRLSVLKKNLKDGKASPALFYGGLRMLIGRIAPDLIF